MSLARASLFLTLALWSAACLPSLSDSDTSAPDVDVTTSDAGGDLESAVDIGDGASGCEDAPDSPLGVDGEHWTYVSAGESHVCALTSNGHLYCWGDNRNYQFDPTGEADPLLARRIGDAEYKAVATGISHTCAIDPQNQLWCWGHNGDGHVRPNSPSDEVVGPEQVLVDYELLPGGNRILDAGKTHTCALVDDDAGVAAVCWGEENAGLGAMAGTLIPLGDPGPKPLLDVGRDVSCVVTGQAPTVRCWGEPNDLMQFTDCRDAPCTEPRNAISTVGDTASWTFKRLSASHNHGCFIRAANDDVWCWGDNSGERRVSPLVSTHPSPPVDTGETAIDVSAGADHTCAVLCGGDIRCWGEDRHDQLGNTEGDGFGTVSIEGQRFVQVSAGARFTCAVTDLGQLYCWGYNLLYQLGTTDHSTGDAQTTIPQEVTIP